MGVLSTLDYYLANIKGMKISIIMLISIIYIIFTVSYSEMNKILELLKENWMLILSAAIMLFLIIFTFSR